MIQREVVERHTERAAAQRPPAPPPERPPRPPGPVVPGERITDDALIYSGPSLFWGLSLRVSPTTGYVTIYDGATPGGRRYGSFWQPTADETAEFVRPWAALFHTGLYVELSGTVQEVTVHAAPLSPEQYRALVGA